MTTNDGYGDFFTPGQAQPASPWSTAPAVARPARVTFVPETVTASAALLLVAAVAALWLGLTMLTVSGAVTTNGGPILGGVTWRGVLLVANGCGNVALAYFVRQGVPAARWVTVVVCAGWTLDWLYHATQTTRAFSAVSEVPINGLGSVGAMATLGVLLLAAWAVTAAALLWTSSANEHFRA
jgi:hypothetical protein